LDTKSNFKNIPMKRACLTKIQKDMIKSSMRVPCLPARQAHDTANTRNFNRVKKYLIFISLLLIVAFNACRDDELISELEEEEVEEEIIDTADYSDWTETTHSNNVDPDYSIVFKQNEVLRFDIKISSSNWAKIQADLAANIGKKSAGTVGGTTADYQPVWVPCSFKFDNKEWYNVGVRYKGNSSLRSVFQSNGNKFSFKLDFDEFEDDYPALENQRFYGFKQLNLNNNFKDFSFMHENMASGLFRQFGLVCAHTAFCVVYVDKGAGSQYYGVYSLVEEVDDTVLDDQFADGSGNLYKPEGAGATFARGTFNTNLMYLKTNTDSANYSDVKALYDIINSSERTTNTEAWLTTLESVFNVDGFLKWLAANTTIQNWDTYGTSYHNYYLYNNPQNGLLTWIPWDNNEAFQKGKDRGLLSLSLDEVKDDWPLIRYIIDQPEYVSIYKVYLQQFIDEVFIPSEMISKYNGCYELIKEYVYAEQPGYSFIRNNAEFDQAVEALKTHVQARNDAVNSYLNK